MTTYPDYVHQTLARAREEGEWYVAQADAAALCFDVLALFPDCEEAKELVHQLFCDEWTIYDSRVAIQQNIEEWGDRPWQQRRRLALSYRFMSRWEGWEREYRKGHKIERGAYIKYMCKLINPKFFFHQRANRRFSRAFGAYKDDDTLHKMNSVGKLVRSFEESSPMVAMRSQA